MPSLVEMFAPYRLDARDELPFSAVRVDKKSLADHGGKDIGVRPMVAVGETLTAEN
jgi:hypothetical protein